MNDDAGSGSGSASSVNPNSAKVPRPAPLHNPRYRHISRSAAKRESVQLLGSIKDLQLRFSQAGLVEHRPGSGAGLRRHLLGEVIEGEEENVPPSADRKQERRPWKDVELPRIDPGQAKREAKALVGNLRTLWDLSFPSSPSTSFAGSTPSSPVRSLRRPNTRAVLVSTADAIRKVRALAIAASPTASSPSRISGTPVPVKSKLRSSFSTPSRPSGLDQGLPRAVSYCSSGTERKSSLGLGDLRKTALEVLAALRSLEEDFRICEWSGEAHGRSESPLTETNSGASTGNTESTRPTSPGTREAYESEEEEYNLNALAQTQGQTDHLQTWEERIVSEDRSYHELDDGEKVGAVREAVRKWVAVVERIFGVTEAGSTGEVEEWAKEGWEGRPVVERLRAFLLANVPVDLHDFISSPAQNESDALDDDPISRLLTRLSDGYILTQAFNFAVASSPKPWGFIPPEDIHDTLLPHGTDAASEGSRGEKEWTFRRIGNLTCWAAAIRLRYNLPIHIPSHATLLAVPADAIQRKRTPSPAGPASSRTEAAPWIEFDPLIVAKRGDKWDIMLETITTRWIDEAAAEMRMSHDVS